ncbi:MAG TPA: Mut7-C RNAse domain-containing protein [Noviherbaspirillum sp.]|nr:Mut7-C RNAse domain-containing protein [Noviherbaspirillum sp.]
MILIGGRMAVAEFLFHAELNRFIAPALRARRFSHPCARNATVKHMIEVFGVPHTEVGAVWINGVPVDFSTLLREGDRVEVRPWHASRNEERAMLRRAHGERFVADAHLGQLARNLRMLGFDVLYRNDFSDAEVAALSATEDRIVLTRDRDLLIRKQIEHGCFLHATHADEQVMEVLRRFRLADAVQAFSRCLSCNAPLQAAAPEEVAARVPPQSHASHERFFECVGCERVYWEGSHVVRMRARIAQWLERAQLSETARAPVR